MDALATGHDPAVEMIDTSVVRVHQHGACTADSNHEDMGRSRGGLTSKIHAVVDTNGLPVLRQLKINFTGTSRVSDQGHEQPANLKIYQLLRRRHRRRPALLRILP
jgi:hypothetical protein